MGNTDFNDAVRLNTGGAFGKRSDQRVLAAMQALGQSARLSIFRLLVQHEPAGLSVGAIALRLNSPQNTASAHLATLARAHLVSSTRYGRSVRYRADLDGLRWLIAALLADCCQGNPALDGAFHRSSSGSAAARLSHTPLKISNEL